MTLAELAEGLVPRQPSREICALCHEVSRVGFYVPDEIWRAAMRVAHWSEVVCLRCFTLLADERCVEWDDEIEFYPVSQVSHLKFLAERDAMRDPDDVEVATPLAGGQEGDDV